MAQDGTSGSLEMGCGRNAPGRQMPFLHLCQKELQLQTCRQLLCTSVVVVSTPFFLYILIARPVTQVILPVRFDARKSLGEEHAAPLASEGHEESRGIGTSTWCYRFFHKASRHRDLATSELLCRLLACRGRVGLARPQAMTYCRRNSAKVALELAFQYCTSFWLPDL